MYFSFSHNPKRISYTKATNFYETPSVVLTQLKKQAIKMWMGVPSVASSHDNCTDLETFFLVFLWHY